LRVRQHLHLILANRHRNGANGDFINTICHS
jgi:hypothetical protein